MSFFDRILPTITQLAPTIATGLGGPLAGLAVTALEAALGVDKGSAQSDAGQQQITKLIAGLDPQTAAAMRKADEDFQVQLKQLDISEDQLLAKDTDSARNMQIQTRSFTPAMLAGFVTLGFFGLLALLAFHQVPTENANILYSMTGALGTAWYGVIHFYFGSSAGSAGKDATIQAAMNKI